MPDRVKTKNIIDERFTFCRNTDRMFDDCRKWLDSNDPQHLPKCKSSVDIFRSELKRMSAVARTLKASLDGAKRSRKKR